MCNTPVHIRRFPSLRCHRFHRVKGVRAIEVLLYVEIFKVNEKSVNRSYKRCHQILSDHHIFFVCRADIRHNMFYSANYSQI